MSCKVLSRDNPVTIQRLTLPGAEGEEASARVPDTAPPTETLPQKDVTELHGRIVELERALQRDVRQAREAGFREGEAAGKQQASAELKPVLDRLARSINELAGVRAKVRRETEADLVSLAIAIARRILRREIAIDPDAVQGLVKAALEKVQARDICKLRVHPDHLSLIRKHVEAVGASRADLTADSSLQPGDLIIETQRGDLDASIETQLREIERGFTDRFRQGN